MSGTGRRLASSGLYAALAAAFVLAASVLVADEPSREKDLALSGTSAVQQDRSGAELASPDAGD